MNNLKRRFFARIAKLIVLIVAGGLCVLGSAAPGAAKVIVVSSTIQAAVDAANPGDTVRVPPGSYRENVLVTKNNISIDGSPGAVLDGAGASGNSGITVRPQTPSLRISRFRLSGLEIENSRRNGVILI